MDRGKQVFEHFYTTRLGEGNLGLGLNVIYISLVHLMNGHVECIVDAEGAHFVLFFPCDVEAAKQDIEVEQERENNIAIANGRERENEQVI